LMQKDLLQLGGAEGQDQLLAAWYSFKLNILVPGNTPYLRTTLYPFL